MDNFSQDMNDPVGEKEIGQLESKGNEIEDIQFEEVLDIDAIQKKLQAKIYENDEEPDLSKRPELEIGEKIFSANKDKSEDNSTNKAAPIKIGISSKKYVIYVDPENVDYMENLSLNERKAIINKVLKEHHEFTSHTKRLNTRKKFFKHSLLASFTFIIGFPLMFIVVNKALTSTINNYQQAKQNISKLYKEQGKIKMEESGTIKNIKY